MVGLNHGCGRRITFVVFSMVFQKLSSTWKEIEVQANMLTSSNRNSIEQELIVLRKEQAPTQPPNRNIMLQENDAFAIAFQESQAMGHQVWGKHCPKPHRASPEAAFAVSTTKAPWVNWGEEKLVWQMVLNIICLVHNPDYWLPFQSHTHVHFIDSVSFSQAGVKLLVFLPPSPRHWAHRLASSSYLLDSKTSELVSLSIARLCLSNTSWVRWFQVVVLSSLWHVLNRRSHPYFHLTSGSHCDYLQRFS